MKKIFLAVGVLFIIILVILMRLEIVSAPIGDWGNNDAVEQKEEFNKDKHSLSEPSSVWVVVNKKRPLPQNYEPSNMVSAGQGELMRQDAKSALDNLIAAASNDNIQLRALSGYRSYSNQSAVYNSYVARDGQDEADTYSARPGHSEHQTGLVMDLGGANTNCDLEVCFGDEPEGRWLANNAHKFGFVIRYPEGKQDIVGYQYEPWHLRYVGNDLAGELHKNNTTMEEFFGLPPAPNY